MGPIPTGTYLLLRCYTRWLTFVYGRYVRKMGNGFDDDRGLQGPARPNYTRNFKTMTRECMECDDRMDRVLPEAQTAV